VCDCPSCKHMVLDKAVGGAIKIGDTAVAQGVVQAGHAGMGTMSTVVGKYAGDSVGGLSGAIRGAGAASSVWVGGASFVGGVAGSVASKGAVRLAGGGRGAQNYAGEAGDLSGSVGAGAIVGGLVAGPPGAAAGAAVGAFGYGFTKAVSATVSVFIRDDRHDWGPGVATCRKCASVCQNRGCKACKQKLCLDCWREEHVNHK